MSERDTIVDLLTGRADLQAQVERLSLLAEAVPKLEEKLNSVIDQRDEANRQLAAVEKENNRLLTKLDKAHLTCKQAYCPNSASAGPYDGNCNHHRYMD